MQRCLVRAWLGGLGWVVPSVAWAAPPALPEGDPAASSEAPAEAAAPAETATPPDPTLEAAPADATVAGDASVDAGATVDTSSFDADISGEAADAADAGDEGGKRKRGKGKDDSVRADDPGMVEGRREGLMPTNGGPIGLFYTMLPDVGGKYTFRFRLHTDFFRKSNFMYAGDTHARVRGAVTIGFTPFKFGELFFSVKSSANRNERPQADRQDAKAVFALGDVDFGIKAAHRFKNGIGVGGVVGLGLLSGSNRLRTSNVNFWFDGMFAVDLRYLTKKQAPVRISTNLGWMLDNSLGVANYAAITDPVSREVSRFALGGNHSRVQMRYAVDFPVRLGKKRQFGIDPILEWSWDVSTRLEPAFRQPNVTPSPLKRSSQWLTVGMRANVVSGLHIDAAADIGLVSPNFEYGPPTPPWQIILGLGWTFDPVPVVREVEVAAPPPAVENPPAVLEGRIVGQVLDPNGTPIPDAKVLFPGVAANAILTDSSGAFTSFRFPAGQVAVQVEVNGQVAHEATAEVKDGEDTSVTLQLANAVAPATGIVQGSVTDQGGAPVAFSMRVSGQGVDESFNSTEDGRIALELFEGEYRATITALGFKEKIITFTVRGKGEITVREQLERDAPVATPNVSGNKSGIKLKKKIRYNGNDVHAESYAILDELASFLNGHPEFEAVEVGVHTDDRGAAQQRTDERADAVKAYLIGKGVAGSRLSAKGYGASKPVAVNMTEQGRAKNNRTVFSVKSYK